MLFRGSSGAALDEAFEFEDAIDGWIFAKRVAAVLFEGQAALEKRFRLAGAM